jgi:hypothetical protein
MDNNTQKRSNFLKNIKAIQAQAYKEPPKGMEIFEYIYKLEGGKMVTRAEAMALWAGAGLEKREQLAKEFEGAEKIKTNKLGFINTPPRIEKIPPKFLNRELLLKLITGKTVDKIIHMPVIKDGFTFMEGKTHLVLEEQMLLENIEVSCEVVKSKKPGLSILVVYKPCPDFDDKRSSKIPKYTFTFSTIPYWRGFLMSFEKKLAWGKINEAVLAMENYRDMCTVAEKFYFGNGSLEGMVARIEAFTKQREELRGKYVKKKFSTTTVSSKIKEPTNDLHHLFGGMFVLQLSNLYDLNSTDLDNLMDHEYQASGKPATAFKVNTKANAGPLWNKVLDDEGKTLKKGDVLIQDFTLAKQMLVDILTAEKNVKLGPEAFWAKWDCLRLFNAFGKAEVYEKKTLPVKGVSYEAQKEKLKTRIIASLANPGMIPACFIFSPFLDGIQFDFPSVPFIEDNSLTLGSLFAAKLSLVRGTAIEYMHFLKEVHNTQKPRVFVFADNIYYYFYRHGKVVAVSIDLVKAESSMTPDFVAEIMKLILYETFTAKAQSVSEVWMRYATEVFPELAARAVALISNQQVPYPSWASGAQGTFVMNCFKSACIVFDTVRRGQGFIKEDNTLTTGAKEGAEQNLAKLTVELVTEIDFKEPLPDFIAMDMIGFDVAYFQVDESHKLPFFVLNKERMFKSLLFDKDHRNEEGEPTVSHNLSNALKLIKLKTLFLNGGWFYPGVNDMLYYQCNRILKVLRANAELDELDFDPTEFESWFSEVVGEDSLIDAKTYMTLVATAALPTIYELVELHTGDKDTAQEACESRIGTMPLHYIYPPSKLPEGFEGEYEEVVSINPKKLVKMFPDFTNVLVRPLTAAERKQRFYQNTVAYQNFEPKVAPPVKTRSVAVADVGKPKMETKAEKSPIKEHVVEGLTGFFIELGKGGRYFYRVPLPETYYGKESEIIKETSAARGVVEDIVQRATGVDQEYARAIIANTSVVFFFFPVFLERVQLAGGSQGYLDPIDKDSVFITPGKLITRTIHTVEHVKFANFDVITKQNISKLTLTNQQIVLNQGEERFLKMIKKAAPAAFNIKVVQKKKEIEKKTKRTEKAVRQQPVEEEPAPPPVVKSEPPKKPILIETMAVPKFAIFPWSKIQAKFMYEHDPELMPDFQNEPDKVMKVLPQNLWPQATPKFKKGGYKYTTAGWQKTTEVPEFSNQSPFEGTNPALEINQWPTIPEPYHRLPFGVFYYTKTGWRFNSNVSVNNFRQVHFFPVMETNDFLTNEEIEIAKEMIKFNQFPELFKQIVK